jgi:flagellar hook-basal body complex protein FliE
MKIEDRFLIEHSQFNKLTERVETPDLTKPSFMTHLLTDTNNHLLAADNALQELATGHSASLHQTMLTLEEAKLSFQYLEQIRNRLMSAYQDILREQI